MNLTRNQLELIVLVCLVYLTWGLTDSIQVIAPHPPPNFVTASNPVCRLIVLSLIGFVAYTVCHLIGFVHLQLYIQLSSQLSLHLSSQLSLHLFLNFTFNFIFNFLFNFIFNFLLNFLFIFLFNFILHLFSTFFSTFSSSFF